MSESSRAEGSGRAAGADEGLEDRSSDLTSKSAGPDVQQADNKIYSNKYRDTKCNDYKNRTV